LKETVLCVLDESAILMLASPQKRHVARYSSFAAAFISFFDCLCPIHISNPMFLTMSGSSPTSPPE